MAALADSLSPLGATRSIHLCWLAGAVGPILGQRQPLTAGEWGVIPDLKIPLFDEWPSGFAISPVWGARPL